MTGAPIGKNVLITGASRGIGRAVALAMAEAGATVACCSRSVDQLAAVARECGRGAIAVPMDLEDPSSIAAAAAEVESRLGSVDVLVNNGGIAHSTSFAKLEWSLWRQVLAIDLDAAFLLTQAVLPGMLRRDWGRVIMMSSVFGRSGGAYVAAYASAKHGLIGLTRALAAEYARTGLTFNAVCPGFVETDIATNVIANISRRAGIEADEAEKFLHSPQGRLVTSEEVAAACVFLASDAARSITGQSIGVDGGRVN